jgi:starch synthase
MVTREWPPDIYGGAGVHVQHLVGALRHTPQVAEVDVFCFGEPRVDALARPTPPDLVATNPALQTLGVDISLVAAMGEVDIVHSHTWYANLAGHIGGLLKGVPHVMTAHSLEPLRPWKAEQLGGGYRISSWVEEACYRDANAVIAVSEGMRTDLLEAYDFVDPSRTFVVHNGVDTQAFAPDPQTNYLDEHRITTPYVLFVGRITRQKGLAHLLNAAREFPDVQLVLCASSPDTPEIAAETAALVEQLRHERGADSVRWIDSQVPHEGLRQLYSNALAFLCPSIYEPLGIVNLEAMACACPVIASAVGGIPEVVVNGETGILVNFDDESVEDFRRQFAAAVWVLAEDPELARRMGAAGRQRAIDDFDWQAIAAQTVQVYYEAMH